MEYQFAGCDGDKRYLVGQLQTINLRPKVDGFEQIHLKSAINLDFYPRYVDMYQNVYAERPWMPDVSRQESLEDMQDYLNNGWLYEVFIDDAWAGVTAVSSGFSVGAKGYNMIEIALEKAFRGQGLGVVLQRQLALLMTQKSTDDTLAMFGTIGAVNTPMLKTATRVGRTDVGGHFWVTLCN